MKPPITEPLLLERLGMDEAAFVTMIETATEQVGRRDYDRAHFERAIGYPWVRPANSYVLRGEEVEPLTELDTDGRHPLLAFGSNGTPTTLATKFGHFDAPEDRDVFVVAGHLHDFDVGAAAAPTAYGSMPATLFPSPGTKVRAAVLWVTPAQLTQLAWSEISYRIGLLDTAFTDDEGLVHRDSIFAFVSRWGSFAPRGEPVAQAAIPARDRTAPELAQEELLAEAARLALHEEATAEDLVRAIFEDFRSLIGRRETLPAVPFASDRWQPFAP